MKRERGESYGKKYDKDQERAGQIDGSHGDLPGTRGNPFNKSYQNGIDTGRFDYDRKKHGDNWARIAKADRDIARKISEKKEEPEEEYTYKRETSSLLCPVCGEEYDGYYCFDCGYDNDSDDDDYYSSQEVASEEEEEEEETEREKRDKQIEEEVKALAGSRGRLYVTKHISDERLKDIIKNELWLYTGITFVPPHHLVRYRCDRCGHEWDDIWKSFGSPKEIQDCIMGCSKGADGSSLWGLYKIIEGLITGKKPFGYGRLISSKEL